MERMLVIRTRIHVIRVIRIIYNSSFDIRGTPEEHRLPSRRDIYTEIFRAGTKREISGNRFIKGGNFIGYFFFSFAMKRWIGTIRRGDKQPMVI